MDGDLVCVRQRSPSCVRITGISARDDTFPSARTCYLRLPCEIAAPKKINDNFAPLPPPPLFSSPSPFFFVRDFMKIRSVVF